MRQVISNVATLLFPRECLLCKNSISAANRLCDPCYQELPWNQNACRQCAKPLPPLSASKICGECSHTNHSFQSTIAALRYEPPIPYLVTHFKFWRKIQFAKLCGELLATQIKQHYAEESLPQCVIPIPLHHQRLRQRGYNQANLIAAPVAQQLNIPLENTLLFRHKITAAQTEISLAQRQRNTKNAFTAKRQRHYQHVAIIDDVMTTGCTANAVTETLLKTGIKRVDVWVCARAVMK